MIDDQADWFDNVDVNVWLNKQEKEKAQAAQQARTDKAENKRRQMRVTLDLAGRRIVEAADSDEEEPQMGAAAEDEKAPVYAGILNPSLRGPPPVFTKGKKAAKKVKPGDENPAMDGRRSRVQQDDVWADMDTSLETAIWEMEDDSYVEPAPVAVSTGWAAAASSADVGLWQSRHAGINDSAVIAAQAAHTTACLSMHQPWATLLVEGIKCVEGRSWPTTHRGLMWIASTAQPVESEQVAALKAQYSKVSKARWPKEFPHGHLLGIVNIIDCMPQQDYFTQCPPEMREENSSEFLFVCADPHPLAMPYKVSGRHKIWDLPSGLNSRLAGALVAAEPLVTPQQQQAAGAPLPPLDLFPNPGSAEHNHVLQSAAGVLSTSGSNRKQILASGVVLLKGWLSIEAQNAVVAVVQDVGTRSEEGFSKPKHWSGNEMHLEMLHMGKKWTSGQGYSAKDQVSIPDELRTLASTAAAEASKLDPRIPTEMMPDIALANYYTDGGWLGQHQDKDESQETLDAGTPVVSVSVGDTCDFSYTPVGKQQSEQVVKLESGDVLVFGGPSRRMHHGVLKVYNSTKPRNVMMRPGRLNLTFRQQYL